MGTGAQVQQEMKLEVEQTIGLSICDELSAYQGQEIRFDLKGESNLTGILERVLFGEGQAWIKVNVEARGGGREKLGVNLFNLNDITEIFLPNLESDRSN